MIAADHLERVGKTYFRVVPVLGICVLGWSLLDLYLRPPSPAWLALAALTILTGSFTVKIPGLVARLSVSEPFVFAATLWFGPSVGAVTAALDALIMSLWLLPNLKTVRRIAFNVSVLVISIWFASQGFFALSGIDQRAPVYASLAAFVVPLYLFTATCFILNSGLVAVALAFERRQPAFKIWREQFLWLSLNYFGGASVAAVLVVYARSMDWAVVGVIVPLLAISYLTFRTTLGRLDDANTHLMEVNRLYLSTIETLAMAVDAKDQVTHGHIRRVQRYALGLAQALGIADSKQVKAIEAAALLHDMGKLAIPEYILNKPGRLTASEFEKMKLHAGIGADILSSIKFPYPVIPIVRHHHENWNGSGYPDGLKGTAIPMGARILSVVDCFDALTSDRPYRPRLSSADAMEEIFARRGVMYDPVVVDAFASHLAALRQSAANLGPEPTALRQIAALNTAEALHALQSDGQSIQPATRPPWIRELPKRTEVGQFATIILGQVVGRFPAAGCAVSVVDDDGESLVTRSVAGLVPDYYLGLKTEFGKRITGWVAANRTTAVNSVAALDLDQGEPTTTLKSSLVCPVVADKQLRGVVALYSELPVAFSQGHRLDLEAFASLIGTALARADNRKRPVSDLSLLQVLSVDRVRDRWPVGIVVTQFSADKDSAATQQAVFSMLRSSVRAEDSMLQIESNAFLLLLLRSDDVATTRTAKRLREELAMTGVIANVEWASVAQEGSSDAQAMDFLAETIRRKTETAANRRRRTTH